MTLPCKNLNLNLYRVFYTVAKTKSFSESSRTLHISQPAISKHIQNLEYELNTLLFYRTNRGIELTPEAKALLVYVEKAYNYLMLGERELQEGKELTKGHVTIGITPYLSNYYFNNHIKDFMKSHPNITINMTYKNESSLIELLQQHSIDLLIIPGEYKTEKDLSVKKLLDIEYCFATIKESDKAITGIEELANKPLLLPSKKTNSRIILEKIFNKKNIVTNPIMELDTTGMILNYIKEGIGIGYIPKKIAEQENLIVLPILDELPKDSINLIYSEESLTSSSKEFIKKIDNQEL